MLNSLVGRKVVSVSRTPGHTKYFQTYYLTPTVKLCDCPGLVFPSQVSKQLQVKWCTFIGDVGLQTNAMQTLFPEMWLLVSEFQILAGIYPVSQLQEPYSSVGYLCERTPFLSVLKLTHPEQSAETPHTPNTHEWTAWDVCEGKVWFLFVVLCLNRSCTYLLLLFGEPRFNFVKHEMNFLSPSRLGVVYRHKQT